VNIGVVALALDGSFADYRLSQLERVKRMDPLADTHAIELFLEGIAAEMPLAGGQEFLHQPSSRLTVDRLREWSREFGGTVRLSEPRVAIANSGAGLIGSLYDDYVAELRRPRGRDEASRPLMRPEILTLVDRTFVDWNVAKEAIRAHEPVHGRTATHIVDRSYRGPAADLIAIAHAISFEAKDLGEVFANRATIAVAAEDIHERAKYSALPVFAVHTDAPADRADAVSESVQLFHDRDVTPVRVRDLSPLRSAVDLMLHPAVSASQS
jgi:hypothetical protein